MLELRGADAGCIRHCGIALLGAALLGAAPLAADPRGRSSAGLEATVAVLDAAGAPATIVAPGDKFAVRIRFADPATREPVTGLYPVASLRRTGPGKPACAEAARALRATGRLSRDDIPLTGTLLLSLGADGRLALIEPDISLATSNIAAILPLPELPAALLAHSNGTVIAALANRGEIIEIALPSGKQRTLATGLDRPRGLLDAPGGRTWVLETADFRLLDASGTTVRLLPTDTYIIAVPAGDERAFVVHADGSGALIGRFDGGVLARFPAGRLHPPLAATAGLMISAAAGTRPAVNLIYADAPAAARAIDVGGPPTGIAISSSGRHALVWSNAARSLDFLDLTAGRRVHAFAALDEVDEAMLIGDAAFIAYRTRAVISVVNLLQLAEGDAAARDVRLAEPDAALVPLARHGPLMASLAPASAVLVARPGSRTVFTVMSGGGLATAPMSTLTIRSERPLQLTIARRLLREVEPGTYEALASVPTGGAWELVATTGVQGTTVCAPLPIVGAGEPAPLPPRLVVRSPSPKAGMGAVLNLAIENARYDAGVLPPHLDVIIAAIDGGWVKNARAVASTEGTYRLDVTFPWGGRFPIAPRLGGIAPSVVEVVP